MPQPYITTSSVASATPFDNTTNGFVADNVQAAIEEVRNLLTSPGTDQIVYVTKNGNDTSGNGSFGKPFLTVAAALTSITSASPTKRYVIDIGPGDYSENLTLKANVFLNGHGPLATRITGSTIDINNTTWNVASADNRSGAADIAINNVATWDFTAQAGNDSGKLYFWNIRTSGAWTATALNAINQMSVQDAQFFGGLTCNGMNTFCSGVAWQSGSIVLNSSALAGVGTTFTAVGGRITGNITAAWTANLAMTVNLAGLNIGSSTVLTASGASCTINANDGSLPVPANRSIGSGATLNRLNDNFARGLLSQTTNVECSTSAAPLAGQALIATSSTAAAWQFFSGVSTLNFGDGSDGDLSISSGTTTLTRTMYYNNLTISSTAVLDPAGYKIYVKGTLTISGSGTVQRSPNNGGNSPGTGAGAGATAMTQLDCGAGLAGAVGVAGARGGLFGSSGVAGNTIAAAYGYGGSGGQGGNGGSGTGGAAGTYQNIPERIIRHDHLYRLDYKTGGQGGSSGGGGSASAFGTGGGGGGGGGGGAVIIIFANTFNNTSSLGVRALGGNGGNGNQGNGNAVGGGGGGGGGGGHIYIITNTLTALGTLNVSGGSGGSGGAGSGSRGAGTAGQAGGAGHTTVFHAQTSTWTVT